MSAALISAFVNSAILSAAMAGGLTLVFHFSTGRYWNASTRYAAWFFALLVTLVLPLSYVPIHPLQGFGRTEAVVAAIRGPAEPVPTAGTNRQLGEPFRGDGSGVSMEVLAHAGGLPQRAPSRIEITAGSWTYWIVGAWILTSILMLLRLLISYVMLHRRKARAYAVPALSHEQAGNWLRLCGSGRKVELAVSGEIATPVAAGPFRPYILIPSRLYSELKSDELDQIGLHEAAHFARHDDYALLFQRICECLFVFHPVVRWITRRLDLEREVACDDFVVTITGRPRPYAECLTRVVELANGGLTPPLAAPATAARSVLERRLDMLMDKSRKGGTRVLGARMIGLMAALALTVWVASSEPQWVVLATPVQRMAVIVPVQDTGVPSEITSPAVPKVDSMASELRHGLSVSVPHHEFLPVALASSGGAAVAPQTPSNAINFVSYDKEIAMGRQLAAEVERQVTLVDDTMINAYVDGVGQTLVRNSDAKIPFTFKVVKAGEVNALALPGGFFYINTGLILNAANEAELAAVMAHLIAHVTARHGAEQQSKGELLNVASIPLIFLGGPIGMAVRQSNGLLIPTAFYAFSRTAEMEADYLGLQYMFKTGYDPKAAARFSERLEETVAAKPELMSRLFATHPMTSDRLDKEKSNIGTILPDRDRYILTTPQFDEVRIRISNLN